jgi:hypothetical protein
MAHPVAERSPLRALMRGCLRDAGLDSSRPLLPPERGGRRPAPAGSAGTVLGGAIGRIRLGLEAGCRRFLKFSGEAAEESIRNQLLLGPEVMTCS